MGEFKTIYADPPWHEQGGGKCKRGADKYYNLMPLQEIIDMAEFVNGLSADNCHLYLWATNNHLLDALKVMEAWGFKYITMITWLKGHLHQGLFPVGDPLFECYTLQNPGLGQYYRGLTEHCLFGRKGMLPYKTYNDKRCQGVTGFIDERREHSQKPEEMRRMIEAVSHAPRIELFARERFPTWEVWGDHWYQDD